MRDLASKIASVLGISPAVYAATTTPADIDLQGYDSAVLNFLIGIGGITFTGTNRIDFLIQHADDNGAGAPGAYANVTAADINGAGAGVVTTGYVKSLIAAHAAGDNTEIGYIGGKRFLQVSAVFGGTHGTGTPIAVLVSKGHPRNAPAA